MKRMKQGFRASRSLGSFIRSRGSCPLFWISPGTIRHRTSLIRWRSSRRAAAGSSSKRWSGDCRLPASGKAVLCGIASRRFSPSISAERRCEKVVSGSSQSSLVVGGMGESPGKWLGCGSGARTFCLMRISTWCRSAAGLISWSATRLMRASSSPTSRPS